MRRLRAAGQAGCIHVPESETKGSAARVKELEHQLASTKEYLQTTIEELETRSTSMRQHGDHQAVRNEELITVNSELQQKIDALSKANDEMNNLLAATQIGIVFLGYRSQHSALYPACQKDSYLMESDIGRPTRHIVHNLEYEQACRRRQEVLVYAQVKRDRSAKHIREWKNWYSMRVHPYWTTQDRIDGVVVTFIDISDRKRTELDLQESERRYRGIEELFTGIWTCAPDGKMTYLSQSFLDMLGLTADELPRKQMDRKNPD